MALSLGSDPRDMWVAINAMVKQAGTGDLSAGDTEPEFYRKIRKAAAALGFSISDGMTREQFLDQIVAASNGGVYLDPGAIIGGGGGVVTPPTPGVTTYYAVHMWNQSNMTGAQESTNGGTLVSPADDADPRIKQYSPNGGTGAGDPTKARILLPATGDLLFPSGVVDGNGNRQPYVGPGFSYAKAILATLPSDAILVLFPFGKGGTPIEQYVDNAIAGGSPQPLFVSAKAAWDQFCSEHTADTVILHSIVASPSENEMLALSGGQRTLPQIITNIGNAIASWRSLQKASAATPIYWGSAVPEYVEPIATNRDVLTEYQKFQLKTPNLGMIPGFRNSSSPGDTVHYTNNVNRTVRGPRLATLPGIVPGQQTTAPAKLTGVSLNAEQLSFTANGAPMYVIQTSAPGANTWSSDIYYAPNGENQAGTTLTLALPGTGSRDFRISGVNYATEKTTGAASRIWSDVGNYTVPNASLPTPVIDLDWTNAAVDGSGNVTSIPSKGSQTEAWVPYSSAGSGALAAVAVVDQSPSASPGTKKAGSFTGTGTTSASKRIRRTTGLPSGSFTANLAIYLTSTSGGGVMIGWGGANATGDFLFSLANTGANIRGGFGSASVQVITTGSPLTGMLNKWHMITATYDITTNTLLLYLNGTLLATSGTPVQRTTPPVSNPGGTDFYGYLADTNSNGLVNHKAVKNQVFDSVLTSAQINTLKAQIAAEYGITFG